MKAWVLHEINDFALEEVETPNPCEGEVLLRVRAVGICGSDIPRIYKTGTYSYPLIPGHEFAGEVVRCGKAVPEEWLGQRAGVFPLIPCGECLPCRKQQYEMCRHYSYLGSRRAGGFAEYVTVPVGNLLPLPTNVTFEQAAMLEPMAVAVHAMRRVQPDSQDVVAVCGLGTIGLLLLMFLKEAGIKKILAIGNKEFQRRQALKLGIPEEDYCDIRLQDSEKWLQEKTNHNGINVFFECVGKNETVSLAVGSTAPAGRVMLVGNPYSDMLLDRDTYWKILRNQLTVTGSWNSSFTWGNASGKILDNVMPANAVSGYPDVRQQEDDWHYVLKRLEEKKIAPGEFISHSFPLEELEKGFHIMRDKSEDYVKVMGILQ